MDNNPSVATYQ